MSHKKAQNIVMIILAVVGVIAIIGLLGMWLMHATMMSGSGMMAGGVMNCCGGMMRVWLVGLILILGIVMSVLLLIRRRPRL
jgi:uncharacterized membrane protein